jgi:tripartite-type tricarboxylate transporter receptor subunit TctC
MLVTIKTGRLVMLRASVVLTAAAMAWTASAGDAGAEYPERPVTMVVVFPAGGTTDLIARTLQPAFAEALGTEVVIKNTGGGGGTIGTAETASAEPDGYTIGIAPIGPTTTQPHLRDLPYDTLSDLQPICRIYNSPVVLAAAKDGGFETLDDVIAEAEAGTVIYGSPAPGSIPHVVMVALEQDAGIEMKHIPFEGTAAGMKALLGGVVNIYGDVANFVPQYDLHPIAVYNEERLPEFPDVPTMAELGHDLSYSIWGGIFAPAETPPEVVEKLSAACEEAVQAESTIEGMANQQTPIAYMNAKEFTAFVRDEHEKNAEVLEAAGLKKN